MKKLMQRDKGFTLIELMIVILIIAILVAIAVPVFLNARRNAQTRTCQANLRTIEGAVNTYMADANVYPGTIANMTSGTYSVLKNTPQCPTASAGYGFTNNGNEVFPTVSCPGSPAGTPISGHSI